MSGPEGPLRGPRPARERRLLPALRDRRAALHLHGARGGLLWPVQREAGQEAEGVRGRLQEQPGAQRPSDSGGSQEIRAS